MNRQAAAGQAFFATRLMAATLAAALAAASGLAEVPPPEAVEARIIVNGRTSTAVEIPVVKVGQEIPATYAGDQIAAVPGFEFYVSEHFALRSSLGDEHARRVLEISELAHPHWVALIGAEPPDPARRMFLTYGKNPEELHRAMVADLGMGPLGGFAGGFTAAANRSAYNYPSGTLEYHQRALVIHENLHMLTMICHGTGGTEGPTYAGEQHVYDPAAKRLTVFCFDKACVNNYTDVGLAALRERFIPMHEAVRKLWQGGGGSGTVYQQFFLTDPDRLLKWRIWRDEYYAGRVSDDTNAEIMAGIHGPLDRLNDDWARWVRDRRASFHSVEWGWEQDANTLWAYGFPHDPKFWSQTDLRLPPGEKLGPDPLRLDYPAEPQSPLVGPVARGGEEPTIGFVAAGVDGQAWGGFGLGVEGRSMCRVVIVGGRTLVVDGEPLGMPRREFPLGEEVQQAAAADGGRHGVTIRIGREALAVTVRAGPADRLAETAASVPLDGPQRQRLLERPLAIIGKDGYPRVTPWVDDSREPPPDFAQPAPANRWRFAGLDRLETLYRAAWRLGDRAPESLNLLKTEMLLAVEARPERQAEAVAEYEARIDAVARAVAGCAADEPTRARALADLAGVLIRFDAVKPGGQGDGMIVTGRLTGRLDDPIDVRIAVTTGSERQPAGEPEAFALVPRRPREFRRKVPAPAEGGPPTATTTVSLAWRGRSIEVPFEHALAPAAEPSARGGPTAALPIR